jgi:hypothetical protein
MNFEIEDFTVLKVFGTWNTKIEAQKKEKELRGKFKLIV